MVSAKETLAMRELLELLECRYALRILWALKDGHAQTFRLLADSVENVTPNTLNARLKALRAAGLIDHSTAQGGYALTAPGADLAKRLEVLPAFATKWMDSMTRKATVAKKKAAPAPAAAKKSPARRSAK